jgi:hypothetical protein
VVGQSPGWSNLFNYTRFAGRWSLAGRATQFLRRAGIVRANIVHQAGWRKSSLGLVQPTFDFFVIRAEYTIVPVQ